MKIPLAAIDVESTGTDAFHGCKPYLVTACDGKHNYLWEGTVNPQTRDVVWEAAELLSLQLFINSCSEIVFQNGNFDIRMLETIGIYIPPTVKLHDTLVASHLVCSGDVHGLKECAIKYHGIFNDPEREVEKEVASIRGQLSYNNPTNIAVAKVGHPHFPAATKTSWKQDMWLALDSCKKYGTNDVELTILLHKTYTSYLHQNNLYQQYLSRMRTLPILYRMQTVGINLYIGIVDRLIAEFELQQYQLVELIKASSNCPYNIDPAKPDDLKLLLYHILKLEVLGHTDGGQPSTDAGTLIKLEKKYDNIDTIRYLKGWRKVTKVLTDIKAYKLHMASGRIHSTLNLTGTKWTRLSSSDPNQQNFNKKLDFIFGPPKGYYWLYMDVVNIELRIWAYDVGAKSLIESFERGDSVHMIIAHALYPEMIAKLGETEFKETKMYTRCKGGTFTRLNGGGIRKVEETYGVPNSCAIIDEKCPEIGQYFRDLDAVCSNNVQHFNYPTMFTRTGYKLEVPLDKTYTVLSARIQGTAGHMVQNMMQALAVDPVYKNPLYGPHAPTDYIHPDFPRPLPPLPSNSHPPSPTTAPTPSVHHSVSTPPSCEMIQQVHDSLKIEIPCHPHSEITNKHLVVVTERSGEQTIPTCPMDYKVIEYSEHIEPVFRDYTFIPRIEDGYEIEMYMHEHQYMCIATFDKDTFIKHYAPTKQQAYELVLSEIKECPF